MAHDVVGGTIPVSAHVQRYALHVVGWLGAINLLDQLFMLDELLKIKFIVLQLGNLTGLE